MQQKGGPRLLVTDRDSALMLERARIHVEGARVVYHITDDEQRRQFNIPHVNLAVLFAGQGTSITQEAFRLLAEEGVYIAFTGTGGTPLHMGSLSNYTATDHFRRILPIYLSGPRSLLAAKSVMSDRTSMMRNVGVKLTDKHLKSSNTRRLVALCERFDKAIDGVDSISTLLGHEGQFSKSLYSYYASESKIDDFVRDYGAGKETSPKHRANSFIDHGNYLCYGLAGAALWALGIPPSMSIFHGKTRAGGLVFDIADSFKESFVLPLAFSCATKKSDNPEKEFRAKIINEFNDKKVLAEAIKTVNRFLENSVVD